MTNKKLQHQAVSLNQEKSKEELFAQIRSNQKWKKLPKRIEDLDGDFDNLLRELAKR